MSQAPASTKPRMPIHIAVGRPRIVQLLTRYVSSRVRTAPYHMMYIRAASPAKSRGAKRRMTHRSTNMPIRLSAISYAKSGTNCVVSTGKRDGVPGVPARCAASIGMPNGRHGGNSVPHRLVGGP